MTRTLDVLWRDGQKKKTPLPKKRGKKCAFTAAVSICVKLVYQ